MKTGDLAPLQRSFGKGERRRETGLSVGFVCEVLASLLDVVYGVAVVLIDLIERDTAIKKFSGGLTLKFSIF